MTVTINTGTTTALEFTEPVEEQQLVTYGRQELVLEPKKANDATVNIFGCGTVGSNAAVEIAKLGVPNFKLFDFDKVESHNVPSQRFGKADIGRAKLDALVDQLASVSNDPNITKGGKVTGPVVCNGIAIVAVDSMAARKLIWEKVLKPLRSITLAMDFRMSANVLQVYSFNPNDKDHSDNYPQSIFDDKDADPVPCGGRTVSYTGALSGAFAANYVRKHLNGDAVPYFTAIDLDAMHLLA